MGVGVQDQEVFAAADAVLARGERPTYERVRAELGRGSPARIGALLETWWAQLAQRLAQQLALPALPAEVGAAFAQAWESALAAGRTHAEGLVAPERAALADTLAKADAAAREAVALRDILARDLQSERARADSLAGHITEQHARLADHAAQLQAVAVDRTALQARLAQLEDALAASERGRTDERVAATRERDAVQAHARQVEDRALAEVDRAREALKQVNADARKQAQSAHTELAIVVKARDAALAAQHKAERRADAAQAALAAYRSAATTSRRRARAAPSVPVPAGAPRARTRRKTSA